MTVRVMFVEVFNAHGMVNVKQKLAPHKGKKKDKFLCDKTEKVSEEEHFLQCFLTSGEQFRGSTTPVSPDMSSGLTAFPLFSVFINLYRRIPSPFKASIL